MSAGGSSQSSSGKGTSDQHSMGFNESGALGMSRTGTQFSDELGEILRTGMSGLGDYSKSAAISDVNGVLKNQALTAMQAAMPSIAKTNTASGAYNSTTKDLLANDFNARLAGQLAETQLNAINTYGGLSNNRLAALTGAAQAGNVSESVNMSGSIGLQEALGQSSNSSSSSGGSANIGLADGGVVPTKSGTKDNKYTSLLDRGTDNFDLFKEFFKFDGKGGRNSNLTILPGMLAMMGIGGSGSPGGSDVVTGDNGKTPAPADATTPKPTGELDNIMRYSDPAMEFLKLNGFKSMDEAIGILNGPVADAKLWDLKGTDNLDSIKEFKGNTNTYNEVVRGWREPGAGYADGGQVMSGETANSLSRMFEQNLFEQARARREAEAGLTEGLRAAQPQQMPGVVINVGTGQMDQSQPMQQQQQQQPQQRKGFFGRLLSGGNYEDGGEIDDMNLQQAMQHFAMTGQAPSLKSRLSSGGEIQGPQSKSGRDNQVVAVGGGEGVIPKDVMEVPGVAEGLRALIQTFHKPVK